MSAILEVSHTSKRFGKKGPWVLKDINFSANRGDFITFIGPSGCGKTTLLKLIAGLTTPSEGTITSSLTDFSKNTRLRSQRFPDGQVQGADGAQDRSVCVIHEDPSTVATPQLAGWKTFRTKSIGYVFQDHNLLPWLDVRKNIELALKIKHVPQDEHAHRVNEVLNWLKLERYSNYYPWQLSGGTKMRVSIARALALNPQILLFDEPFAALDEMTRYRLNEDLLALQQKSDWTAFFVTHSISEAVFLSSDVYIISEAPGQITQRLPITFNEPRNAKLRESFAFQETVSILSEMLRKTVTHTLHVQPR